MKLWRTIQWSILVCACLGAAAALWVWQGSARAPSLLPPLAEQSIPAALQQALAKAYRTAQAQQYSADSVRAIARLYHANRRFAEADQCYQLIAARPGGLGARDHYYRADIARAQGDLPAAEEEFREVLRLDAGYLPARLALAEVLFKSGQAVAAAQEFAAVLAIEPGHLQASLGLARLELQRGDEAEAARRLEELLADHPEATMAAATLAPILERRGETDRAVAMTQWSLQKPEPIPPDPWLTELLADVYDVQRLSLEFEVYSRTGQMEQAMRFLSRIEELDPSSPVPQMLRGWSHSQAHRELEAVREYRRALDKGGDPDQIVPYLVRCLLTLGDAAEAEKIAAEYHRRVPDSAPVATAYAEVAMRQGQETRAKELLSRVLDKQPYQVPQNMSLAKILWHSGDREAAAQCLQRVARAVPGDVASRALLGEYHLGQSEPIVAIGYLEQAYKHGGSQPLIQQQLGRLLLQAYLGAGTAEMERVRFAEAMSYFDRAIRLAPGDLKALAGKANAAVQLRQFRAAAEALARMAALEPKNPTVQLSWGDVLYLEGETEKARAHWSAALPLTNPTDTQLRAALDERLSGRITEETFR